MNATLRAICAAASIVLSASVAAADESWPVAGEHDGRGPFRGVLTVPGDAADREVELRLVRRFARDLSIEELVGRGRRRGGVVEGSVRRVVGAAELVASADGAPTAAESFRLELEGADQPRWTLRLLRGRGVVATAKGKREELADLTGPATRWKRFEGVAFLKAPEDATDIHASDPRQGQLGDCYLIAAMISLANNDRGRERLRGLIVETTPGSFTVSLKGEGQFLIRPDERTDERVDPRLRFDDKVAVDARLPVGPGGDLVFCQEADRVERDGATLLELWPNLIERAYAQSAGGYLGIKSGWPGDVYRIVGGSVTRHKAAGMTDAELERVLAEAAASGAAVCISSGVDTGATGPELNVVADHSYALLEVKDTDGGKRYVLYNPWGSSHPRRPLTAAELRALGATIEVCGM